MNIDSVINGCLLGDMSISYHGKTNCRAQYGCKYKCFLEFLSKIFHENNIKQSGSIYPSTHKINKAVWYSYRSRNNEKLTKLQKKWYVNNSKIVPRDLKLDETSLLFWYLGDGSIRFTNLKKHTKTPIVRFSTDCFYKEDKIFLCNLLLNLGINAKPGNVEITLKTESIPIFFDLIKCPSEIFDIYGYKFRSVDDGTTREDWFKKQNENIISGSILV